MLQEKINKLKQRQAEDVRILDYNAKVREAYKVRTEIYNKIALFFSRKEEPRVKIFYIPRKK